MNNTFGPIVVQENHEVQAVRRIKASQLSDSESLIVWQSTFEGGKGPRHYIKAMKPVNDGQI